MAAVSEAAKSIAAIFKIDKKSLTPRWLVCHHNAMELKFMQIHVGQIAQVLSIFNSPTGLKVPKRLYIAKPIYLLIDASKKNTGPIGKMYKPQHVLQQAADNL